MRKLTYCCSLVAGLMLLAQGQSWAVYCNTTEPYCKKNISTQGGYSGGVVKNGSTACDHVSMYTRYCESGWTAVPVIAGLPQQKKSWVAKKLDGILSLFVAPAYASHSSNGENHGVRNGSAQSGSGGRSNACRAMLDVCFGNGHQDIGDFVDEDACLNLNIAPSNINACSQTDFESRCRGGYGTQVGCS